MLGHKVVFWAICMKHTNELKVKHLVEALDGPTNSKDGYTGQVGKLLSRVNALPVNYNFRALPGGEEYIILTEEQAKKLTTDSYICYRYVNAIKEGKLTPGLANLKCGALSHAGWLTTGEAILMIWTRGHGLTGKNAKNLETLFRCTSSCTLTSPSSTENGPYHILTELRYLKTQPANVRKIVTP